MRSIEMINQFINPPKEENKTDFDFNSLTEKMNDISATLDAINLKMENSAKKSATKQAEKKAEKTEKGGVENGNTEQHTDTD